MGIAWAFVVGRVGLVVAWAFVAGKDERVAVWALAVIALPFVAGMVGLVA